MNRSRLIGLTVLLVVVAAAVVIGVVRRQSPQAAEGKEMLIQGFIGSEKETFFSDPDVKQILSDKYHIAVQFQKAGSLEMLQADSSMSDFLFPGSDSIVDMFKQTRGKDIVKSDVIFTSPIAMNSSSDVTAKLTELGIVQKKDDAYFVVDMPKLIDLMEQKTKWAEIGLPQYYGTVSVVSTDPNKSNSGAQFAALLANTLKGEVVDLQSVDDVIPTLKSYYSRLGFMENSTGNLFDSYIRALKNGVGDKPIIAAYENLMIEYAKTYPQDWEAIKDKASILYPVPTVWSQHPIIALDDKGVRLMEALKDPDIQKLAWEKHGFRSGVAGVSNELQAVNVLGVPQSVGQVVPMPNTDVMDKLLAAIQ